MVVCLIALPVLAVLAIFMAKYRPLAKEAFACLLKTITLKKCESGLNERIRSRLAGKVMTKSPKAAGFLFKHFTILSWIFFIVLLVTSVYAVDGVYKYLKYGNCNGPGSTGFCPLSAIHPITGECLLSNTTCEPGCKDILSGQCKLNCTCAEGVCK